MRYTQRQLKAVRWKKDKATQKKLNESCRKYYNDMLEAAGMNCGFIPTLIHNASGAGINGDLSCYSVRH